MQMPFNLKLGEKIYKKFAFDGGRKTFSHVKILKFLDQLKPKIKIKLISVFRNTSRNRKLFFLTLKFKSIHEFVQTGYFGVKIPNFLSGFDR